MSIDAPTECLMNQRGQHKVLCLLCSSKSLCELQDKRSCCAEGEAAARTRSMQTLQTEPSLVKVPLLPRLVSRPHETSEKNMKVKPL